MAETNRLVEAQFLVGLLAATRAERVVWTATIKPGSYQVVPGDYLLVIGDEGEGPVVGLHHRTGPRLETFHPARFNDAQGRDFTALFDELYERARAQALGLHSQLSQLTAQLAGPTPAPPDVEPAAPRLGRQRRGGGRGWGKRRPRPPGG